MNELDDMNIDMKYFGEGFATFKVTRLGEPFFSGNIFDSGNMHIHTPFHLGVDGGLNDFNVACERIFSEVRKNNKYFRA